jgi:FAD/FMN-containing dehydrogenase
MSDVTLADAFVARNCEGAEEPQPAVTIGAGALWMHVYDAVTTRSGRYVQGGGCGTVGVAGLIQSGGFGSFSKNFGLAAAGLLEAEVVTADGAVRTANACTNPDLFWALKGGGGGAFGVVTRVTLRTHELPNRFGAVFGSIRAESDRSFRDLVGRVLAFYRDALFDRHWGEQLRFGRNNTLTIGMLFQGLTRQEADALWRPFFSWVDRHPRELRWTSPPTIMDLPARRLWDPSFVMENAPHLMGRDTRPGAPEGNVFWSGDQAEAGQFLHGYRSAWLPAARLESGRREALADAIVAATRHWPVSLHFNKGLAGASAEAKVSAGDTAMNPAVLDAFALAIIAGHGPPAAPGHTPDLAAARRDTIAIEAAMGELLEKGRPTATYVAESDFFQPDWQQAFWGPNYPRLLQIKQAYDPDGLFFTHHGVGSEAWSGDGFTPAGP